jgi:hypothetical protein
MGVSGGGLMSATGFLTGYATKSKMPDVSIRHSGELPGFYLHD